MTKEILLSKQRRSNGNQRNVGLVALVDDEDYEFLSQWNWSAVSTHRRNSGYAMRLDNRTGKTFLMHRVILDAPSGAEVDHINGNGLDNRRANLRFATRQQGQANRRVFKSNKSGFKGVHFDKVTGKWKMVFSAHFDTAEEAARTYDKLAKMVFGDYAKGNFEE
jgi:HNH endonuclease